jgi:site-specific recombinase XerD
MVDIHNYERRLARTLENIKNSGISNQNKQDILQFSDFCFSEGLGRAKIHRYCWDLHKLATFLNKDFKECAKPDIQKLIAILEQSHYSPNTKRGFRIAIKKFFKWLRGIEDKGMYPEEVRWITTTAKANSNKRPEDLLTEEDVLRMINSAGNERDRAFIATLYESGCRIAEILSLKIKHIAFDEYGCKVAVSGKTGSRRIRLVSSPVYLQAWLNKHPDNTNHEAFVWVRGGSRNELIGYSRMRVLLSRIAQKAGISKRVNPHSWRHARASLLANHLTEAQLKEVFGWEQSSKMAAIYVHLSGRDTDEAILKVYGKVMDDKKDKENVLTPKDCPRCKTINEATNRFCKTCGTIIDESTKLAIVQNDFTRARADEWMNKLFQDKEFREFVARKIQQEVKLATKEN